MTVMQRSISFLLLEDDDVDQEVFRRALRKRGMAADLQIVEDGTAALANLRSEQSGQEYLPDFIFVDLNMPGMSGHEFLAELRADPKLKQLIVFVLTSSQHARDVQLAYERNVAGYFVKSELPELLECVSHFVKGAVFPYRLN